MALPDWIRSLEFPSVLQPEGPFLHFIFVAYNVSRIGCRYSQHSVSHVVDQFPSVSRSSKVGRVLLLHLVLLALCRDSPPMQSCDFRGPVEIDPYHAAFSPSETQNLERRPYVVLNRIAQSH